MEDPRSDHSKHRAKNHTMNQHNWRASGTQDAMLPSVKTRASNGSLRVEPPSPPRTPMQKPLYDQIHELQQYHSLLGRLQSWYLAGLSKIQQSTKEGGHNKTNAQLITPAEAAIHKIQRLRSRIGFSLHQMSTTQQGFNNEGSTSAMAPLRLSDLLRRNWDAPHLDRKTVHQILISGGYEPESKSRVSQGPDLKPSDPDFFELCDAIEQQMKDLANNPPIFATLSPPKAKVNSARSSPFGPIEPPCAGAVPKESQNATAGKQTPAPAPAPATTPKTTNSPSMPLAKPLPPTPVDVSKAWDAELAQFRKTISRISQKTDARASQPENEVKPVVKNELGKSTPVVNMSKMVPMPRLVPESLRVGRQYSTPTTEVVNEVSIRRKAEMTTKPKPGLSKLRHELRAEFPEAPAFAELPTLATTFLRTDVFTSELDAQLGWKAGGSRPFKPAPPNLRNIPRAQLKVLVYRNGEPQPNASSMVSGPLQPKIPTKPATTKPMRSTLRAPDPEPEEADSEPDWESLFTITAYCECCGVEHEDFDDLVWEDESDIDSGIEVEDEGGEEGGLLITNRDGQVVEEDNGEELNIKGDYFLANLNGIVKQTLEDRDAIAEWDDGFAEEPGGKEDGEYCVV